MSVDLNSLQRKLAEYKVYDAWPYVLALMENIRLISLSKELAEKTFEHRKTEIDGLNQRKIQEAFDLPVSMNPFDAKKSEPNYWLSCLLIDEKAMAPHVRGELDDLFDNLLGGLIGIGMLAGGAWLAGRVTGVRGTGVT